MQPEGSRPERSRPKGSQPRNSVEARRPPIWWSQTGSNRRPPACKAGALPTELWPLRSTDDGWRRTSDFRRLSSVFCSVVWELVGLGRFELPTSRLSSARSNQLSYKPAPGFRSQSSPVQSSPGPVVSRQIKGHRDAMAHLWRPTSDHRPLAWARPRRKRNVDGGVPLSGAEAGFDDREVFEELLRPCVLSAGKERSAGRRSLRSPTPDFWPLMPGILRKEVIQPQVPLRLPCYDFTPVTDPTVAGCLLAVSAPSSGKANSHGVTGGVYKARERIHRGVLIHDY